MIFYSQEANQFIRKTLKTGSVRRLFDFDGGIYRNQVIIQCGPILMMFCIQNAWLLASVKIFSLFFQNLWSCQEI